MKIKKFSIWITIVILAAFVFLAVSPVLGAPKDTVRVWVSYQSGKKAEVARVLKGNKAIVNYDFPELEAYVVTLPTAALNGIVRNPFVLDVEADPERYPIEPIKVSLEPGPNDTVDSNGQIIPWGIDAVQARQVWDPEEGEALADGTGIKVCIIDTGYYVGHEDLMIPNSGLSQVDNNWDEDGYGHGTHVAGTISALDNDVGVVGVTPGTVDFHIVKIFDNSGAWVRKAHASDLVKAIYSCQDAGANIISMSLSGTSSNKKEQKAFDALYEAGILNVAAASNEHVEGAEIDPYHYPASYDSVISVAAVDSASNIANFSQRNDKVELAAPGVGVLSTIPYIETNSFFVNGTAYTSYHVEYSAYSTASGILVDGGLCDAPGSWDGNIVLCQRGNIDFSEKVANVEAGGGAAAVIYNNVDENLFATLGDGNTSSIVAISISMADGEYLVANMLDENATVDCKYSWPDNGYEAWNGTSMATPHVSGVAALIWSAEPEWTNVQIREAMTATAIDLGDSGKDVMFGFGLVQAYDALNYLSGE
ncbi:MAG: S8 family serine peptidase [Anaerolineales bacterium]